MIQEVLDILTKNLTNERLDNIIQKDKNYQDVLERLDIAYQKFEKIYKETQDLEMQDILNDYDTTMHEESALHVRLAYQQGMKDFAQLLVSLIQEPSF